MQLSDRRIRRASLLLPIVACFAAARAETLTYGIDAGMGETDNVTLEHQNKIAQTIAVTDFDLDYKQKSQRLDVDAKANFSYLDYLQNAFGNQLLGRFDGSADVALIPQRLTWQLREDFGQATIDPFIPTTPSNLENINNVSTGPELYLRLGGSSFVDFSARVAHAQYEFSPFSNSRGAGSAEWGLKLSPFSSISVNADTEKVYFDNTQLNTDFTRTNAFVRYEVKTFRTEISADLGATSVREDGGSSTGGLAKFKLVRKVSPSARVTVTLGHDSTDGSTSFSGFQSGAAGAVGAAPATNTSQNYLSTYGTLGWEYQRNRTTVGLSGRWEKDDYSSLRALDRKMTSGELRFQRLLTRTLMLQITGRLYKSDYGNATLIGANGSPYNETNSLTAGVTWRHGRALEVKVAYEHTTYTTSPNDTGYQENRIFLTVGYRPLRESTPGAAGPVAPQESF